MLGMHESDIFREINRKCFDIPKQAEHIKDQPALNPDDILRRIATGVAKAIAVNNKAIENQLRAAGLSI